MDLAYFRDLQRHLVKDNHLVLGSSRLQISEESFPDASRLASILKSDGAALDAWLMSFVLLSRLGRAADVEELGRELQRRGSSGSEEEQYHLILTLVAGYCAMHGREEFATKIFSVVGRHMDHDAPPLFIIYQKFLEMMQGQEVDLNVNQEEYRDVLPSVLLQGCMSYNNERYADALASFAKALRLKPDGPPGMRFSLGMCYSKMGKDDLARRCFTRTLELDPSHVDSMLALAVLELNAKNIRQGMHHVQSAYRAEPGNSRALNFLADHFLVRSRFDKVEELAQKALQASSVPHIKAESLNLLGRASHAQGRLDEARDHYTKSLSFAPNYMMSRYGLGQLHLASGQAEEALKCFRAVTDRHPDDFYTLKLVGLLMARKGEDKDAITFLQRAIDVSADDPETLFEFAGLVEKTDPERSVHALRAALKAASRDEESDVDTIRRLRNNVGVMLFTLKMYDDALHYFQEIVDVDNLTDDTFTVAFNLARTMEELCHVEDAIRIYKALLARHPTYIDCYLRLGLIQKRRGDMEGAQNFFKDALVVREDHPSAWALLGNLHMETLEFYRAQKKYERVLSFLPGDTYAEMALGNMYFQASFQGQDKERSSRQKKYALDRYYTVLARSPSNAYAANGIGCVLADEGRFDAANKIFQSVQEGAQDMPDVLVNLAHTYFARGHFQKAITLYKNALRHFSNRHPKLILYLSRSLFEAQEYDESAEELQRAIHLWPNKPSLWFNLAIIRETPGKRAVTESTKIRLPIERIEACQQSLRKALKLYEWLASDESISKDVQKRSAHRITRCTEISEKLEQAREVALEAKRVQEEKRRIALKRKADKQKHIRAKREREEEEKLAKEQERQQLLEEDRKELEAKTSQWKQSSTKRSSGKRSKKAKHTSHSDRELLREEQEDEANAVVYDTKTDIIIGGEGDEAVLSAPVQLEDWQLDLQQNEDMLKLIENKKRREDERRGIHRKSREAQDETEEGRAGRRKKRIKKVASADGEDQEEQEEEELDVELV